MPRLDPYDAVLLLSFGGPERPEDVVPFLENVTRGRGVPAERLREVATHYDAVGGRSPINDQNRALVAALRGELANRGYDVPVGWGNRNWAPYCVDALRDLADAGARRVVVVTTSAYSSYSSCRQYRENLADAVIALAAEGRAVAVDRVRAYYDHPGFADAVTQATLAAVEALPDGLRDDARLVFVTHSIPVAMDESSGPDGQAYAAQHAELAGVVGERVAASTGQDRRPELTYCSRSGPPGQPWLEPDVNDHLRRLAAEGVRAVVLVPIGFVSDHMEVVHDLDAEAADTARRLGLELRRAATVGTHPDFVAGLVDVIEERAERARGGQPREPVVGTLGPWPSVCVAGCCPNARAVRPAACGADWTAPLVAEAVR
ncbi:MAG: ferrochelatase [Actinomycetales bacterium]